ncbi:MAG TPA: hypothetical protein VN176_00460 [Verrucomicrobiae bacterium]|jgi:hypothetical protein|nr:hypothetical protein [Verrucomicrobiae bacterium]
MLHQSRSSAWIYIGVSSLLFCFALPVAAQKISAVQTSQKVSVVRHELHHDVSQPLSTMALIAPVQTDTEPEENEPVRRIPLRPEFMLPTGPDTVRQQTMATPSPELQLTAGLSFEGLGDSTLGFTVTGAPPDTNGAVGPTQYVQWVNTSFAIFDKTTGNKIQGPTLGNALWVGFGGVCETGNRGDPVVTYDKLANRWVFSQFGFNVTSGRPVAPFTQCIAVSTTFDATGPYNRYSFTYSSFDDYPKMGVWPDAYYETFNLFNGNTFVGGEVCAYDRNAMLSGLAATQQCVTPLSGEGGLLPSDFDGTIAPPAGSPNYVVAFNVNSLDLFTFHVDFANSNNSTFIGPTNIPVAPFTPLCNSSPNGTCVPQPDPTQQLDSLADRLMYRLAYRNFGDHESLVVNHSVVAGSSGGVRWYEIQSPNSNPTIAQQSTFAPDTDFRWMGSIAMDKSGGMAMGYSVSSSATHPSIAVTGRTALDTLSTMQTENVIISGTGSQCCGTRALSRWGDYSAMQVDPSDDCTFWYTTEYIKADGIFNWNTHIDTFKLPNCAAALRFKAVTPCRVADTRNANGPLGGPFLAGGAAGRAFTIPGTCGIPTSAQAYSLNVTVVPHGALNFLTAFPCGQPRPLASNLNSVDGRIKAVAAILPAGTNGADCFFASNDTDLVLDIDGYFVPATDATALAFYPVTPCRLVDTRLAAGPLGGPSLVGGNPRTFPLLSSPCNVPSTAQAYSLNYTSVPQGALNFLATWPAGQTQPLVSTLNATTGVETANAAIGPAGTGGAVTVMATNNSDLVIDINGYFAPPAAGGLSLYTRTPCRVLDTRNPPGTQFSGQIDSSIVTTVCGLPSTAQSFVLNATVVPPGFLGFLTLWPQGTTQPLASTLNAPDGAITSNMAIVPTANGSISAFAPSPTHLVLDISGYFAP